MVDDLYVITQEVTSLHDKSIIYFQYKACLGFMIVYSV
jgi:hypothetical protein